MKKTLLFLALLYASASYGAPPLPKPISCPVIAQIHQIGLSNNLARDSNGEWYAGRTSQAYGTDARWTFVVGAIIAPNKTTALEEAYEALESLTYFSGPDAGPSNKWICLYSSNRKLPIAAVSPPITILTAAFR